MGFTSRGGRHMVTELELLQSFMDSLKDPFLFADREHVIRYMNKAAIAHYEQGDALLGTSLLACHDEASQRIILEVFAEMEAGLDERLITDDARWRIYMRAVRSQYGSLLGYYERYEPPAGR